MKSKVFFLCFTILLIFGQIVFGQEKGVAVKSEEQKFLDQFVGVWIGEGVSEGQKTRDEMRFEWRFGTRFLNLNYRTLEGKDNYTSEGFLWFNAEKKQYEYYEFNNGRWAVRQGIGKKIGNSLVVSEKRDDVSIELVFEFVGSDTMKITESYLNKKTKEPFVVYTFKRKSD